MCKAATVKHSADFLGIVLPANIVLYVELVSEPKLNPFKPSSK